MRVLTLVVFGDSIANGMGCRGAAYPHLLAQRLGASYVDLTATGAQLSEAAERRQEAAGADIALISFGITEAMIRPSERALRFMPKRWRNPGWMDPRPYYSTRLATRLAQRVDSALRWRVKAALIRLTGGMRWGCPKAFERDLAHLVGFLKDHGTKEIVIIGRFGHDEKYFPRSAASADEFLAVNRRVALATGVTFCEGIGICREWEDYLLDHFHPNLTGHERIADHIEKVLQVQITQA